MIVLVVEVFMRSKTETLGFERVSAPVEIASPIFNELDA